MCMNILSSQVLLTVANLCIQAMIINCSVVHLNPFYFPSVLLS